MINPYRYKSYRYDAEIGLYYLNSRYYNPEWGRFINFDNYGGQVGDLFSHNGYAYCKNNPVNMADENGNFAISSGVVTIAAIIIGTYVVATTPPEDIEEAIQGISIGVTSLTNTTSTNKKSTNTTKTVAITGATTVTKRLTQTKKDNAIYYPAVLTPRGIQVHSEFPLSFEQAKVRIRTHQNVMAKNDIEARKLATATSPTYYTLDRPHRMEEEYYWHYHPYNPNHQSTHIWFYGEPLILP